MIYWLLECMFRIVAIVAGVFLLFGHLYFDVDGLLASRIFAGYVTCLLIAYLIKHLS